jgi:hypothetical protein
MTNASPVQRRLVLLVLLLVLSISAAACSAIGGIFKAGLRVGVIVAGSS